jgi:hypothetical protein
MKEPSTVWQAKNRHAIGLGYCRVSLGNHFDAADLAVRKAMSGKELEPSAYRFANSVLGIAWCIDVGFARKQNRM